MTMSKEDRFKTALKMIQVSPENYKKLSATMIMDLCKVIAEAEEKLKSEPSIYEKQGIKTV